MPGVSVGTDRQLQVECHPDFVRISVHTRRFHLKITDTLSLLLALIDYPEVNLPLSSLHAWSNHEETLILRTHDAGDIILLSLWSDSSVIQNSVRLIGKLKLRLARLLIQALISPCD